MNSVQARDAGINQALNHANEVNEGWSEKAYDLLQQFVKTNQAPFMTEDFRAFCETRLAKPPSQRAYGGIVARAARSGLITKIGTQSVKNVKAHMALATLWRSNKAA